MSMTEYTRVSSLKVSKAKKVYSTLGLDADKMNSHDFDLFDAKHAARIALRRKGVAATDIASFEFNMFGLSENKSRILQSFQKIGNPTVESLVSKALKHINQ